MDGVFEALGKPLPPPVSAEEKAAPPAKGKKAKDNKKGAAPHLILLCKHGERHDDFILHPQIETTRVSLGEIVASVPVPRLSSWFAILFPLPTGQRKRTNDLICPVKKTFWGPFSAKCLQPTCARSLYLVRRCSSLLF